MAILPAIGTADDVVLYQRATVGFDLYESALRSLGAGTTYLGGEHGLASLQDVAVLSRRATF
jgi:hypothetical protein